MEDKGNICGIVAYQRPFENEPLKLNVGNRIRLRNNRIGVVFQTDCDGAWYVYENDSMFGGTVRAHYILYKELITC